MLQTLLDSAQDLCSSGLFNNPGKIHEACFRDVHYDNPIFNPCTAAIWSEIMSAITDGVGTTGEPGATNDYYYGGNPAGIPDSSASHTQPSLSDLLPSEYKTDENMTLSDVVD
ncbi:MAG: hypothetical protein UV80_C0010G0024 [Candidatus Peregrinibacteria bacterium GW2011_GWF2_43_17]|nr:MAG: hypothetical protein UV80_C0010G0024 [Candidatus Peregrinibacteria bacterium GW2011_GWF2_43_17]HAU39395.1 hypothetical protein [Candidatus Peregrinibacteria bacterium]